MTEQELIARLRNADEYEPLGHDGWEAADTLTALLARAEAAEAALAAERETVARLTEALRFADEYMTKLQTPGTEPLNSVNVSSRREDRAHYTAEVRNQAREVWAVIGNVLHSNMTLDAARAALTQKDRTDG